MPQLTFAIPSGELKLAVVIGHNRQHLAGLLAAGQALPAPIWTTGVIDTGTNVTCVTPAVLQQLGLASTGQSSSQTVAGHSAVNLFEVSVSTPPPGNVPAPMLTRRDLVVMEMPSPVPGVEVLIGLDILLDCKLVLEGPARRFTLEFNEVPGNAVT
jgi:hypothetical protein